MDLDSLFEPGTQFAPARRETDEVVREQHALLVENFAVQVLDTVPEIGLILNSCRQIVHANKALFDKLGVDGLDDVLGVRAGELLSCVHSDAPGGCGTGQDCASCGVVRAVLGTSSGSATEIECRVLSSVGGGISPQDLKVNARPVKVKGQDFIIVHIKDIADTRRREVMERIFFHDMLNALNGIVGAAQVMSLDAPGKLRGVSEVLLERAMAMSRDIQAHRLLLSAEESALELEISEVVPAQLVESVALVQAEAASRDGKEVYIDPSREGVAAMSTDKRLLYRILENLLKNALEASEPGQPVRIGHYAEGDGVVYFVRNETAIPRRIQGQIFQRSFSTKGVGRGLGAYSVKLFTENYLGGAASFVSNDKQGTTFFIRLPLRLEAPGAPARG